MPTYDYVCKYCEHAFEHFQGLNDKRLRKCPECKRPGLERQFGIGAGVVFKGSGFYETDYKRADAAKKADAPKTDKTEGGESSGAESGGSQATDNKAADAKDSGASAKDGSVKASKKDKPVGKDGRGKSGDKS